MLTAPTRASLEINDLPPRAQSLDSDDLADVFGGCQEEDKSCVAIECCGDLVCSGNPFYMCRGSTTGGTIM